MPGVKLTARVVAKVLETQADARTFLLRLAVDDDQGRLLPGTSARAEIALLRQAGGGYSLYVVEGSGTALVALTFLPCLLLTVLGWSRRQSLARATD